MTPENETLSACPNCGEQIDGHFCSNCGQKNQKLRLPLSHFVRDAFAEYFGIDGRLWRTVALLVTRPGRLTEAYVSGRRAAYLQPLRIYLIATVLFFFLLSLIDPVKTIEVAVTAGEDTTATVASRMLTIEKRISDDIVALQKQEDLVDSLSADYDAIASIFRVDSLAGAIPDSLFDDRREARHDAREEWEREVEDLERIRKNNTLRKLRFDWQYESLAELPPDSTIKPNDFHLESARLFPGDEENLNLNISMADWLPQSSAMQRLQQARTREEKRAAFADLGRGVIKKLPIAIFLLLPVFAFLLKIIFIRRDWYYTEHLVFGLHTHAFAFIAFTFILVLKWATDYAVWADKLSAVIMLYTMIYFWVAMKFVYGQGWIKTLFKSIVLGAMYNFILLVGVVLALVLAATLD